jgi:hypothetical protein
MSEILEYMLSVVQGYLDGEVDVDGFREAFAGAYFHVRSLARPDMEASKLADKLMLPVAEFSGGYRSEASLRRQLASAIRPFAREPVYALAFGYVFGEPQENVLQSGSSSQPVSLFLAAVR